MSDMDKPYVPISCSFYDYLEQAATLGTEAEVEFKEGDNAAKVVSRIKTLTIKDKVEYMVLENGQHIRLDFLISFDGKPLPKAC